MTTQNGLQAEGVLNILKNEVIDVNLEQFAKLFFVLLTLGAIYIIPVLLADRYYIDDFGHSIWGTTWWEWDGRPITSWVTSILNFQYPWSSPWTGNVLVDTGPLFQILSVAILAFIAALLCVRMFNERISYGAALVVFPIIGSPFFLENLSYRFDSLPMSLAVAFAIFAAINLKTKKLDVIIGSLCLATAFGLYQVSVNVFIGTSALLILADRWAGADKAAALRLFLSNAAKLAIACFVYKIFLLTAYPAFDRAEMISLDKGGLIQLVGTLRESFKVVSEVFLDVPLLSIAAIVSMAAFGVRFAIRGSKQGAGILNIFIFVAATLTLAFSIYGPLGFLKHPVLSPRVFMGFAIFLVFILFCYRSTFSGNSEATELFLILPTYYLFFIAFVYGSAAKAQAEYDNHLVSLMMQNLENNHFTTDSYLVFSGRQAKSPVLKNSIRIRIIDRLVQLNIEEYNMWSYIFLEHKGFRFKHPWSDEISAETKQLLEEVCKTTPVFVSQRYKIYKDTKMLPPGAFDEFRDHDGNGAVRIFFVVAFDNGGCIQKS